ncbi:MAG: ribbon-helix-helix protein, CopG family [Polyangiaceae bacterium]
MKKANAEKLKRLQKAMRITSKEELDRIYAGDPGGAADAEFGVDPPKMGRPRTGEKVSPTVGKTVKHTEAFWQHMAEEAKKRGLSLHEAMREALREWLAPKRKRRASKRNVAA